MFSRRVSAGPPPLYQPWASVFDAIKAVFMFSDGDGGIGGGGGGCYCSCCCKV